MGAGEPALIVAHPVCTRSCGLRGFDTDALNACRSRFCAPGPCGALSTRVSALDLPAYAAAAVVLISIATLAAYRPPGAPRAWTP